MKERTKSILGWAILISIVLFFGLSVFLKNILPHGTARQSEVKTNLASIATAEISYFAEKRNWSGSFEEIGWSPTGRTRYVYFLGPNEYLGRPPEGLGLTLPIDFKKYGAPPAASHPRDGFTAVAIGNIDNDDTLDVWWIDQNKTPVNAKNDVYE